MFGLQFIQVLSYNLFLAKSVLKVRFVPRIKMIQNLTYKHVQWLENLIFILQIPFSDSLWRYDPNSLFLQKIQILPFDTETRLSITRPIRCCLKKIDKLKIRGNL